MWNLVGSERGAGFQTPQRTMLARRGTEGHLWQPMREKKGTIVPPAGTGYNAVLADVVSAAY